MTGSGARRVGVLVVTHGDCAQALVQTLAALLGPDAIRGFEALSVAPAEARDLVAARLAEAVHRVDEGAGVLIACDLAGSTAANCCVELKRTGSAIEVLCGVSLPMLVKAASTDRTMEPAAIARAAADTAIRSIRLGDGGRP